MGEAADDLFNAALRQEERRGDLIRAMKTACPCERPQWSRDEDGIFECQACGATFEL